MLREPVVAGTFYPGSKSVLERQLEEMIDVSLQKKKVIGLVSPHAGYVYSGGCAGKGFGAVELPDTIIILGVNHYGFGHPYAIDGNDGWTTPLGDIEIDASLRERLVAGSRVFGVDSTAGSREHSLEVQVPFIQFLNPNAKILPITISSLEVQTLIEGGKELATTLKGQEDYLIVASTDMTHRESAESARIKDNKAIDKIMALDPRGLFETVAREGISMCGVSPTTMMLAAALELGAKSADVIQYTNSGEASGDYGEVVGYLSAVIY